MNGKRFLQWKETGRGLIGITYGSKIFRFTVRISALKEENL